MDAIWQVFTVEKKIQLLSFRGLTTIHRLEVTKNVPNTSVKPKFLTMTQHQRFRVNANQNLNKIHACKQTPPNITVNKIKMSLETTKYFVWNLWNLDAVEQLAGYRVTIRKQRDILATEPTWLRKMQVAEISSKWKRKKREPSQLQYHNKKVALPDRWCWWMRIAVAKEAARMTFIFFRALPFNQKSFV